MISTCRRSRTSVNYCKILLPMFVLSLFSSEIIIFEITYSITWPTSLSVISVKIQLTIWTYKVQVLPDLGRQALWIVKPYNDFQLFEKVTCTGLHSETKHERRISALYHKTYSMYSWPWVRSIRISPSKRGTNLSGCMMSFVFQVPTAKS